MGKTRRQKKMRGGVKGGLDLTWKVDDEEMEFGTVFAYIMEVEEEYDVDILEHIKVAVEEHVKAAGYTAAEIDKSLDIVDVEYEGDRPPEVAEFTLDTGGETEKPIVFTVNFKYSSKMGGRRRRKTRGKKSRRLTRRR
jgi:hypothetical protein